MSRLSWNDAGAHLYETGISKGVLYPIQSGGVYTKGIAWSGISALTESISGGETNAVYADNTKYLNLFSTEEFKATLEAYTYPDDFATCDGILFIATGISIIQQPRTMFGLCYRTELGNDIYGHDYSYKLHMIYGAQVSPSEKNYATVNDTPEAMSYSWEMSTTPVTVSGFKPTAYLVIDASKIPSYNLQLLEDFLYGTDEIEARLPLPDEIIYLVSGSLRDYRGNLLLDSDGEEILDSYTTN